jgi:hypothetical protein
VSPTLRTTWAMLNVQSLALIAVTCFALARMPADANIHLIVFNMLVFAGLAMLGARVARVLEVGVWRVLPDGRRTAIRALGLIVAALSVLFGALFRWAAPEFLGDLPLGMTLVIFINLSLFGFLLLLGMGRQLPRLFVFVYLLFFGFAFLVTSLEFRDVAAFWIGGSGLCAAAWIYASLASFRAPTYSRRRFAWDIGVENLLVLADRGLATSGSPARKLLRAGRTGSANLLIVVLVVGLVSAAQGFALGRLPLPDVHFLLGVPVTFVAIFAVVLASQYARPARQLWLRWADSRTELFRLVERMAVADVCIVAGAALAITTGIAIYQGFEITLVVAFKLLVACFGLAITQAYVGLIFAATHSRWVRALVVGLAVFGVLKGTDWWLIAFGASRADDAGIFALLPIGLVLALVMLRQVALACWRRIDWSHYRPSR